MTTPCEVALAKAYGRIGSLTGQLSRSNLRAAREAALRVEAQSECARLEALMEQLEVGGNSQ